MNTQKVLAVIALLCAVVSLVSSYPLLPVAVLLLAIALLV